MAVEQLQLQLIFLDAFGDVALWPYQFSGFVTSEGHKLEVYLHKSLSKITLLEHFWYQNPNNSFLKCILRTTT